MAEMRNPPMSAKEHQIDAPYLDRTNGPPLAAVLAGAIGVFVLGVLTTLNEASAAAHDFLDLYAPVGPLSGKTLIAVAAWALSWAVLGAAWRRKDMDLQGVLYLSAVLIGLGLIGTYPSFFESFATE